ncbi:hypothetical protein Aglo01_13630 [Actinokineospora globicatena]|nr:hypothetical protein Aglo01_13630 [Actinokineospora globicatena]GLW83714.1 hypothetical protein Aglo02_13540 [Actinokineospora globicatena]
MLRGKPGRAFARLLVVALVAAGLAPGLVHPAEAAPPRCGGPGTPSVVALHSSHFYVDTNAQLPSGYAGYRVSGQTARSGLWLGVDGFTGGVIAPATDQPTRVPLPDLTETGVARYLLFTASAATTTPQSHTITIYTGPRQIQQPLLPQRQHLRLRSAMPYRTRSPCQQAELSPAWTCSRTTSALAARSPLLRQRATGHRSAKAAQSVGHRPLISPVWPVSATRREMGRRWCPLPCGFW